MASHSDRIARQREWLAQRRSGATLKQIADGAGVTKQRVSQVLREAEFDRRRRAARPKRERVYREPAYPDRAVVGEARWARELFAILECGHAVVLADRVDPMTAFSPASMGCRACYRGSEVDADDAMLADLAKQQGTTWERDR